jgi:alpha-1,6-mannosyltransferase
VVATTDGALAEVIGPAGVVVDGGAHRFADGVLEVMARPESDRRRDARARANRYGWPAAVAGMLAVHGLKEVQPWSTSAGRG